MDENKQQIANEILKRYNVSGYVPSDKKNVDTEARIQELRDAVSATKAQSRKPVTEKILDFTGGKELAQGLATAIALPGSSRQLQETQRMQFDLQGQLLQRIKQGKEAGQDVSRLEKALNLLNEDIQTTASGAEKLLNPNELTNKQVVGDTLQLGTTIATVGQLPGAVKATTQAPGIISGVVQGAKTGAMTGGAFGGATGVSQALQDDKTAGEIATEGALGAAGGAVTGGVIGGTIGAITGGLRGAQLRREVLNEQVASGAKSKFTPNQIQEKAIEIAKQQGIDENDINFVTSLSKADKQKANKMIELSEKALTDKRAIERPIDIVGDSMIQRVKFLETKNKEAGKAVNEVAKSLRGQAVDATPVAQKATELIDDLGITKTPTGKLNFENSVFKNTPELQKKLSKFIEQVPTGQADAYDVHIFKKSIDELVDFGTKGEGLKGNSERILKAIRNSADDVLDNTFEAYNKANTDFRMTREVLDEASDLFGKKGGISKERGGQLLRSVFSNNAQRPRVLKLVESLDKTSEMYGKKFDDNLIDQALFTELLEDIYGTQATTALQGQVSRAVQGTQRVIQGIRNPIEGIGDIVASGAEKALGISDEKKRAVLRSLLR